MNEVFILVASTVCLIIGLSFCWPPIERYRRSATVGAFGTLLVVCGVVLMTTFKWTEVAIKISDLEVKLANAENRAELLQIALSERESDIARVYTASTDKGQENSLKAFAAALAEAGKEPPTVQVSNDVRKVLQDAGLTLLPTDVIPDYAVAHETHNPTVGG